ncbi:hypothetical protein HLM86_016570 [Vibrio ostreicida]|nr:hypothetical protein [Vibrio ostreicida]
MIKTFIYVSLLSFSVLILISTYSFLNGSTCNYSIDLHVPDDERDVLLTCYRGKVVVLESQQDEQGKLISKWKIEARQLRIGDQMIYFVYSRIPLINSSEYNATDRFNQISSGYRFLFYRFVRQGNDLYIFQAFPRYFVHKGKIEGKLGLWD